MSAFVAESMVLHSASATSEDFFSAVFAGKKLLSPLNEKYLPPDFPLLSGSVIAPELVDLPDNREYLLNSSQRMMLVLRKLMRGFAPVLKDAGSFDGIILMKSNEAQFDFTKNFGGQLSEDRFSNRVFAHQVIGQLRGLGRRDIGEDKIHIIDSTCASGLVAAGGAARFIEAGLWNRALLIAIDLISIERAWLLTSLGAVARQKSSEDVLRGPFSKARQGFFLSDGAAIAVIEGRAAAQQRGTQASSCISGIFQNCDAETLTAGSEGGVRLAECMAGAMAGEEISLVKAHGSGTELNDKAEAKAIRSICKTQTPLVLSLKGQIGHTLNASGLIELLVCNEMFRRKCIPASLALVEPEADLNFVRSNQPLKAGRMLLNAFGFGGHNASLVLRDLT